MIVPLRASLNISQYTTASASVTFGKIKRKLKAKAADPSADPETPKKGAGRKPKTPKSNKHGATEELAAADTPSKKGRKSKKSIKPTDDDDEEFVKFTVKKEEVADINGGADAFFKEATEYAGFGGESV